MTDCNRGSGFFARGGAWVLAQTLLLAAVVLLPVLFPGAAPRLWWRVAGGGVFVLGGVVGIAGVAVLGRNRTPFPKPREGSRFVQHGIYARVRHPLYTSVMLASAGWALLWQSGAALVVALAQVPFYVAKARREERWLREQFPEYADYARRVPGFVPRFGSWPPPA